MVRTRTGILFTPLEEFEEMRQLSKIRMRENCLVKDILTGHFMDFANHNLDFDTYQNII